MGSSYIPSIPDSQLNMVAPKIDTFGSNPFRLGIVKTQGEGGGFSQVMSGLINGIDDQLKKPDKLMAEAMVNPDLDIHDVMVEVNKAEITMTVAKSSVQKIIQGYDKIISMQV